MKHIKTLLTREQLLTLAELENKALLLFILGQLYTYTSLLYTGHNTFLPFPKKCTHR